MAYPGIRVLPKLPTTQSCHFCQPLLSFNSFVKFRSILFTHTFSGKSQVLALFAAGECSLSKPLIPTLPTLRILVKSDWYFVSR